MDENVTNTEETVHEKENEQTGKADIRNPLSLLAHERSRFATCQWEFLTPTNISIPPYPLFSALRT